MPGGRDQPQLILHERHHGQIGLHVLGDRQRDDAKIEFAARHRLRDLRGARLANEKSQARVLLADRRHNGREDVRRGRRAAPDADRPAFEAEQFADRLDPRLGGSDGVFGVSKEHAPGIGRLNAAAGAVEQLGPHFRLELLDDRGQGGLGNTEFPSRAGHVPGGDDGPEVSEWREFHRSAATVYRAAYILTHDPARPS